MSSDSPIRGRATLTTVASTNASPDPRTVAARTHRARGSPKASAESGKAAGTDATADHHFIAQGIPPAQDCPRDMSTTQHTRRSLRRSTQPRPQQLPTCRRVTPARDGSTRTPPTAAHMRDCSEDVRQAQSSPRNQSDPRADHDRCPCLPLVRGTGGHLTRDQKEADRLAPYGASRAVTM
jgi:hypothetical protein